ncbi:uncharacterized protein DNG_07491 [Cephalotrichum gorgonifer]|uniref:SEC63 domain-containing protein n=1 Tax=Cephalotrichum gorgonifer TaxID=2041049 RepID=A0AAE8N1P5_9PEZI|nr:uncharacterized protein DNG_07491 [Cephalotrichum gorgonifer]
MPIANLPLKKPSSAPSSSAPSSSPPQSSDISIPEEYTHLPDRYGISLQTLAHVLKLREAPSERDILASASSSHQLQVCVMYADERSCFRGINSSGNIRWPVPAGSPSASWEKVYLLTQMQLTGSGEWGNLGKNRRKELMNQKKDVFSRLNKVVRCVIDLMGLRKDAEGLGNGLTVLRALEAGVWEEEGRELLQVDGIGKKLGEKLVGRGVSTMKQLAAVDSGHLDMLFGRNPPFGVGMAIRMKQFPMLAMAMTPMGRMNGSEDIGVFKVSLRYENKEVPRWKGLLIKVVFWLKVKDTNQLLWFCRDSISKLAGDGMRLVFGAKVGVGKEVVGYFSCEEIVGTMVSEEQTAL